VAMTLADRAGVTVPAFQLRQVARRPVFMMSRFDRTPDGHRRPPAVRSAQIRRWRPERCNRSFADL
jgi:hypothetical protein